MTEITGDSPQAVAYAMMHDIAALEGKHIADPGAGADRAYVLELYKECIETVLVIRRWGAI